MMLKTTMFTAATSTVIIAALLAMAGQAAPAQDAANVGDGGTDRLAPGADGGAVTEGATDSGAALERDAGTDGTAVGDGGADVSDGKPPDEPVSAAPADDRADEQFQPSAHPAGTDAHPAYHPEMAGLEETPPYAEGDKELGLGLSLAGYGDFFFFGVSGLFAYYVRDRLAPGIDINYTHVFADDEISRGRYRVELEYPETLRIMPFAKYVFIRSQRIAPYAVVAGGREFEWGSDTSVSSWILGGGLGVHVGAGKRLTLKVQFLALHYWYDEKKQFDYADEFVFEDELGQKRYFDINLAGQPAPNTEGIAVRDADGTWYTCPDEASCPLINDTPDQDQKWFFPLISIGFAVAF